jgi:hypothetical protein
VLGSPAVDDVYAITLDEPRDVTVEVIVSGEEGYWLGLQSVCGDGTTMRRCERRAEAGASRTTYRAVPAGTHYFTVTHLLGTSTSALLTTAAPRPVPTNDTCETATPVGPRAPLVETTTTDDAALDHALSCADPIAPILYRLGDLVYAVSVPAGPARRVRVDASTAGPPGVLTVGIFGGPCGTFTELACANNGLLFVYPPEARSTSVRLEPSLPEGDYFVVIQGSNSFQGVPDVDVRVEVLP